jgi:threonine dehydrogenase-like Zn-dependent dehydrogenase
MKFEEYIEPQGILPENNLTWPLYGAGIDHLGFDGKPVPQDTPGYGPDELLIRHDAVGLCYTDVKEITFGDQHPRLIGRDLASKPIIPGHEAAMTVVGVGKNLHGQYKVGDRVVIQPDVWYKGKSIPYSFGMDGAFRQYAVIGKAILNGDEGNYLIPLPSNLSYAGAALTEPWACVEAAYRVKYRTKLKPGGSVLIVGNKVSRNGYTVEKIIEKNTPPSIIVIADIPKDLEQLLKRISAKLHIILAIENKDTVFNGQDEYDDIIILDGDADEVDAAANKLAKGGILAILREKEMSKNIQLDIGRIHYDNILYVGATGRSIDEAYTKNPAQSELKSEGRVLILGAGGPMGRMHLQRAIESSIKLSRLIATDIDDKRVNDLKETFLHLAKRNDKKLHIANILNNEDQELKYFEEILNENGFDDIEVMVTNLAVISGACSQLAHKGIMNIFAGVKRGTTITVDGWLFYGPSQLRIIGHSGSKLDDQKTIIERFQKNELEPHRSMAALCGFNQIPDGIRAMKDALFPGKIVVYPMVRDFPLTGLSDLKNTLPEVYEKLENGRNWTNEAERTFIELMADS